MSDGLSVWFSLFSTHSCLDLFHSARELLKQSGAGGFRWRPLYSLCIWGDNIPLQISKERAYELIMHWSSLLLQTYQRRLMQRFRSTLLCLPKSGWRISTHLTVKSLKCTEKCFFIACSICERNLKYELNFEQNLHYCQLVIGVCRIVYKNLRENRTDIYLIFKLFVSSQPITSPLSSSLWFLLKKHYILFILILFLPFKAP